MEYDKVRFMKFLLIAIFGFVSSAVAMDVDRLTLRYAPITHVSLSKLMWTYGVHDPKNNEILDHYLAVNNCDLYRQYRKNDFQWERIRAGMRREIDYYAKDYPNRFEIKAVVPLDRYDFERSAFIIDPKFALNNAGSIQIPVDVSENSCADRTAFSFFPWNVKFVADNKFSLKEVPVPSSQAQLILERIKKYQYKDLEGKRAVPLKFEIVIDDVKSLKNIAGIGHVIFKGQLDTITFYEDPQMMKPIWKKSFKSLN